MPSVARRAKDGPPSLPGYEWHAIQKAIETRLVIVVINHSESVTMYYVYLLRSQSSPKQVYTGFTENLRQRLAEHNAGKSTHTKRSVPWVLETCLAFSDRDQALAFERYLKTASGIAFARKRLRWAKA